jgi:hypothetical protein
MADAHLLIQNSLIVNFGFLFLGNAFRVNDKTMGNE